MIIVKCKCGESVEIAADHAERQLRWKGLFEDRFLEDGPHAIVVRWLTSSSVGWQSVGGTTSMTCPRCAKHGLRGTD
jgi:hypothetical protein